VYIFYSTLLFLSLIVLIPIYFVRLKLKGDNLNLRERLGFNLWPPSLPSKSIWIHAVSVGEVLSLRNLVKEFKKRHPDYFVHFSALTSTGLQIAKEKLEGIDNFFFVPLDFKWVVKKFFRVLKPEAFILAESEFWPNLIKEARKQTRGVILVNGRISNRSFKRYKKVKRIIKNVLENISFFLMQTEKDKQYLERLGINTAKIEVAGNLKAEIRLPVLTESELLKLKESLGIEKGCSVIVAGSTRKGEEAKILRAYASALRIKKNILLILVPRHPERAEEIEKTAKNYGFKVQRRTTFSLYRSWDVLIVDTIGELPKFYALSDVTFIGGSLIPWGGHNLLEPAFYGKPIYFGPHMENFSYLAQKFLQEKAAKQIKSDQDLMNIFLAGNQERVERMGQRAKEILTNLQGATEVSLKIIESFLDE